MLFLYCTHSPRCMSINRVRDTSELMGPVAYRPLSSLRLSKELWATIDRLKNVTLFDPDQRVRLCTKENTGSGKKPASQTIAIQSTEELSVSIPVNDGTEVNIEPHTVAPILTKDEVSDDAQEAPDPIDRTEED